MSNSTTPENENSKQNSNKKSKMDKVNKDNRHQVTQATSTVIDDHKTDSNHVDDSNIINSNISNSNIETSNTETSKTEISKTEISNSDISTQTKSISSPTGKSTSSNESLSASMNDKNPSNNREMAENQATPKSNETVNPEQKKISDKHTEISSANQKTVNPKPTVLTSTKSSGTSNTLSIIAIALVIALGAGIYYHGHTQGKLQQETIQILQAKIDQLEPQMADIQKNYTQLSHAQNNDQKSEQILVQQKQLQQQYQQQQQLIATIAKESTLQSEQFKTLQSKVSTLSTTEANLWLLAEADFLVKQAARKLNTEKDVITAIALLTSADASIREMNDPSLHDLRNAMASDISTLSSIKRIDVDGTIIKLYQLSDQLDKMVLISNQLDDNIVEPENLQVSEDISDWKDNLSKSWKGFMADFISITPIDNKVSDVNKPELTANQGAYLRENIRLQLLIAAQAVPGYQSETYHQALAKAMAWVKEYYVADHATNQAFIDALAQLQQQNIRIDIPAQLSSQPLLNKQVEVRLRNLMTQNAKPVGVGE